MFNLLQQVLGYLIALLPTSAQPVPVTVEVRVDNNDRNGSSRLRSDRFR